VASATVYDVRVADLPQVRAALEEAAETIGVLRSLLQAWEPRVRCPQCGNRYSEAPCGPAHAIVAFQVAGPAPDGA
jgi:hypothetical protein